MSEAAWHTIGPAGEEPAGTLRQVDVEGRAVCVGRTAGGWVAFDDTCTHEECSLAEGELDEGVVVCPCHGSEFDVRTGDVLTPPALDPLPIYEAREENGSLLVRLAPPPVAAEAVHAREDHVPESITREASVPGPSFDGLVIDDIDLTDLDVWEERVPYDWLALLRRDAPLHWNPERDGRGFWALTRYDDVLQVSKDWQTFSSQLGGTSLQDLTPEELEARRSMIDTDPPAHTRLRALVNKIHDHAYKVTNEDVAALRGKYSDDQLYELMICSAAGAAAARLDAGLRALDAAEKGGADAVAKAG